jgi:hypothetical protein
VRGDEFGDAFRDRIEEVVDSYTYAMATQAAIAPSSADITDAILAMPEMQEVRDFISRMANGLSPKMDGGRRQMEIWNLSEPVIDWALGGPWW